jgi:hypothetical protein
MPKPRAPHVRAGNRLGLLTAQLVPTAGSAEVNADFLNRLGAALGTTVTAFDAAVDLTIGPVGPLP